jgi:hypothetical protein
MMTLFPDSKDSTAAKNCPDATPLIVEIQKELSRSMKKKSKIPREQNPYFLTGRGKEKRWFFLRWLSPARNAFA